MTISEKAHFGSSWATADRHAFTDEIRPPNDPLTDQAATAMNNADRIHNLLYELESRLFGPEPREIEGVAVKADQSRPSLERAITYARQRTDDAADRLDRILSRL